MPLLADALAFCECRVTEDVTASTHRVFIAEVTRAVVAATSDQACDARCAIELGVAALTVGPVPPEEVAELRRLMEQTEPLVAEGCFVDVDAHVTLNAGFHRPSSALPGTRPCWTPTNGWGHRPDGL